MSDKPRRLTTAAILAVLRNPQRSASIGRAARRRYEERYTFDGFARRTYDLLHKLYD